MRTKKLHKIGIAIITLVVVLASGNLVSLLPFITPTASADTLNCASSNYQPQNASVATYSGDNDTSTDTATICYLGNPYVFNSGGGSSNSIYTFNPSYDTVDCPDQLVVGSNAKTAPYQVSSSKNSPCKYSTVATPTLDSSQVAVDPPVAGWKDYYDMVLSESNNDNFKPITFHDDPINGADLYVDSAKNHYVFLYNTDNPLASGCDELLVFQYDPTTAAPQYALSAASSAQLLTETGNSKYGSQKGGCTIPAISTGTPVSITPNSRGGAASWQSQSPPTLSGVTNYADINFASSTTCTVDAQYGQNCKNPNNITLTASPGDQCLPIIEVNDYKTALTATLYTQYSGNPLGGACLPNPGSTLIYIQYDSYAAATGTTTTTTTGSSGGLAQTCPVTIPVIDWVMCPIINAAYVGVQGLNQQISAFLYVPNSIFSNAFHATFDNFANIALALLVIVGLVMVVGQSTGLEIFAAYTVRKVLPRLVVAIIAISLAWPLLQIANTFFDDLGSWTSQLIGSAIAQPQIVSTQGTAVADVFGGVTTAVGGAAIPVIIWLTIGAPAFIALLLTGLLALFVGFLTLAIRQLVVVLCILTAPLAIAAAVLPGTDKVYRFWRDAFLGSLLMFPIVMGFLAAGAVMSYIAAKEGSYGGLLAVIVYFAPYFLLSVAFRLTTGIMGTLAGGIQSAHGGAFTALKKRRQAEGAVYRERKYGRPALSARSNLTNRLKDSASRPGAFHGVRRVAFGGLAGAVGGYNLEARMSARQAAVTKEVNDQIATGDDSEARGASVDKNTSAKRISSDGKVQYQSLGGAWIDEAAVDAGRKRWGRDTFAQQAILSYEMSKATTEDETQGVAQNFNKIADSWGMSKGRRQSVWLGSAFERQNQHLEYKRMSSKNGTGAMALDAGGQRGFVSEIYERRGSYPLAQMGSNTIEQLKHSYLDAQTAEGKASTPAERLAAVDQQEKIKAIAQTFMHEYSSGGPMTVTDEGPILSPGGKTTRQASTPGAAHVAERVRELAELTKVWSGAPTGYYTDPGHAPTPNKMDQ